MELARWFKFTKKRLSPTNLKEKYAREKKRSKDWELFRRDLKILKEQKGTDETFPFGKDYPILWDRFDESGIMKGYYFHQDLYVARKVYENNPKKHIDIGSRTDGFVAHVSIFRPIEILDIRDQKSLLKNISFRQADLMQLPPDMIEYCDSISSLHAIEHFGLGRYNDPVDYWGHVKAIDNIYKMLQTGGRFYFSVPIGPQRIEYNAHRVFSIAYLLDLLGKYYEIERFSYVDDEGDMHEDVKLTKDLIDSNCGTTFGCGIFELIKK